MLHLATNNSLGDLLWKREEGRGAEAGGWVDGTEQMADGRVGCGRAGGSCCGVTVSVTPANPHRPNGPWTRCAQPDALPPAPNIPQHHSNTRNCVQQTLTISPLTLTLNTLHTTHLGLVALSQALCLLLRRHLFCCQPQLPLLLDKVRQQLLCPLRHGGRGVGLGQVDGDLLCCECVEGVLTFVCFRTSTRERGLSAHSTTCQLCHEVDAQHTQPAQTLTTPQKPPVQTPHTILCC